MEVSGQLHGPATLFLGKEHLIQTHYEAGRVLELVRTWQKEKNPCNCRELNSSCPAQSKSLNDFAIPVYKMNHQENIMKKWNTNG
jgi:hypothetical protein